MPRIRTTLPRPAGAWCSPRAAMMRPMPSRPGHALPDLLVSALCVRPALGLSRRPCSGPDPGILRTAARKALPSCRRKRTRPIPLVSPDRFQTILIQGTCIGPGPRTAVGAGGCFRWTSNTARAGSASSPRLMSRPKPSTSDAGPSRCSIRLWRGCGTNSSGREAGRLRPPQGLPHRRGRRPELSRGRRRAGRRPKGPSRSPSIGSAADSARSCWPRSAQTVAAPEDVDEELRHLFEAIRSRPS